MPKLAQPVERRTVSLGLELSFAIFTASFMFLTTANLFFGKFIFFNSFLILSDPKPGRSIRREVLFLMARASPLKSAPLSAPPAICIILVENDSRSKIVLSGVVEKVLL